ncbi:hypothetical protein D3C86_1991640 [compost metagenome]
MAILRIKVDTDVALWPSGKVWIEDIGAREGGQFLPAQARAHGKPNNHAMMRVSGCSQ